MKKLLLGNEAIAFGALKAGVRIAASYPGTPASEIGHVFAEYGKEYGLYFEWSVNEKVALEVAAGGSYHGLRSMASMKSLGLNVASDVLNAINFSGVGGGLLIVFADDPQAHSSTNEQDGRWHGMMANIPILEPSNIQEAYGLTEAAFEISERFDVPVLMRTVTRLAHSSCDVEIEDAEPHKTEGSLVPRLSYRLSEKSWDRVKATRRLNATMKSVEEYFCTSFNTVEERHSDLGIICCGIAYQYAKEALKILGLTEKISLLRLQTPFPIPEKLVKDFCGKKKRILVLEELTPFAEIQIRTLANGIAGKKDGAMNLGGELTPDNIAYAIARMEGIKLPPDEGRKELLSESERVLTPRLLTLCPGCVYRDVWYILSRFKNVRISYSGDIGCYTLLTFPPHRLFDTVIAMGSSVGIACGGYHSDPEEIQIAVMGDSTFFHSGITGLINAIYNRTRIILIILDNQTTAMTGFEPHPGTGHVASGEKTKRILPEDVARGCGADYVEVVHPFHMKKFELALRRTLERKGVSVIITRHPCLLEETLKKKKSGEGIKTYHVTQACRVCGVCGNYRCPAIRFEGMKVRIEEEMCVGCGVCSYICPYFAIEEKE